MKWQRLLLISFLGNYLINNVVAAIVAAAVPAAATGAGFLSAQYITFVLAAAITVGLLTWWYLSPMTRLDAFKWGGIFGVGGYIITLGTTFVSGIFGVLAQTRSMAQVFSVLPNFVKYLREGWQAQLIMIGFWVIPALLVGFYIQWAAKKRMPAPQPLV